MRVLVYGDIGGSGGYHRYCKGLFGSGVLPPETEVWFVCSTEFYEKIAPLDPGVHVIAHKWPSSTSRILRYLWHLWIYPSLARRIRPDVEFYPTGTRRVYLRSAVTVTSCHNLLLFAATERAGLLDSALGLAFAKYRKSQASSFANSDGVIFTSEYSKSVVTEAVPGISGAVVIANGLDPEFLRSDERTYDFGRIINILYVSPALHYKHQSEVVRAVKTLRAQTGMDLRLRLIGGGDPSALAELRQTIETECMTENVCQLDFVDHADLIAEYRTADLFVFASECEAFGISLLEAMGASLPIACSDRSGLTDLLRDAGTYFDPEDVQSIIDAIRVLLNDSSLRKCIGESANRIAREYTWNRCTGETVNFLRSVVARPNDVGENSAAQ
jgi:glycosyltransferase involved in cell wall biosynthesis